MKTTHLLSDSSARLLQAVMVLATLGCAAAQSCTIYLHGRYEGQSMVMSAGESVTLQQLASAGLNDEISSVKLDDGVKLLACLHRSDQNYDSQCKVYYEDTTMVASNDAYSHFVCASDDKGFRGDSCSHDSECAEGICATYLYEPKCDPFGDASGKDQLGTYAYCEKDYQCFGSGEVCSANRCRRLNGLSCAANSDCVSGRCDFGAKVCRLNPRVGQGQSCRHNSDCTDGICAVYLAEPVCDSLGDVNGVQASNFGAKCDIDSHCSASDHVCSFGECVNRNGHSCSNDNECAADRGRSCAATGLCTRIIPNVQGEECAVNEDCMDGICATYLDTPLCDRSSNGLQTQFLGFCDVDDHCFDLDFLLCNNGECVKDSGMKCSEASDCALNHGVSCNSGVCRMDPRRDQGEHCRSNLDCTDGICATYLTKPVCDKNGDEKNDGTNLPTLALCDRADQCASGETCSAGACRRLEGGSCQAEYMCDSENGIHCRNGVCGPNKCYLCHLDYNSKPDCMEASDFDYHAYQADKTEDVLGDVSGMGTFFGFGTKQKQPHGGQFTTEIDGQKVSVTGGSVTIIVEQGMNILACYQQGACDELSASGRRAGSIDDYYTYSCQDYTTACYLYGDEDFEGYVYVAPFNEELKKSGTNSARIPNGYEIFACGDTKCRVLLGDVAAFDSDYDYFECRPKQADCYIYEEENYGGSSFGILSTVEYSNKNILAAGLHQGTRSIKVTYGYGIYACIGDSCTEYSSDENSVSFSDQLTGLSCRKRAEPATVSEIADTTTSEDPNEHDGAYETLWQRFRLVGAGDVQYDSPLDANGWQFHIVNQKTGLALRVQNENCLDQGQVVSAELDYQDGYQKWTFHPYDMINPMSVDESTSEGGFISAQCSDLYLSSLGDDVDVSDSDRKIVVSAVETSGDLDNYDFGDTRDGDIRYSDPVRFDTTTNSMVVQGTNGILEMPEILMQKMRWVFDSNLGLIRQANADYPYVLEIDGRSVGSLLHTDFVDCGKLGRDFGSEETPKTLEQEFLFVGADCTIYDQPQDANGEPIHIINRHTGLAISLKDDSCANGGEDGKLISMAPKFHDKTQQWTFRLLNSDSGVGAFVSFLCGSYLSSMGSHTSVPDFTRALVAWKDMNDVNAIWANQKWVYTSRARITQAIEAYPYVIEIDGVNEGSQLHTDLFEPGSLTFTLGTPSRIFNFEYDRAINLPSTVTNDGGLPNVWEPAMDDDQLWTITDLGDGRLRIKNPSGNKCLNMQSHAASNGGLPNVWNCGNHPDQYWRYVDGRLENINHENFCLQLDDGDNYDGGSLTVWTCGRSATNQIWNMGVPASVKGSLTLDTSVHIKNNAYDRAINIQGAQNFNGGLPNVWQPSQHNDQFWIVTDLGNGQLRIKNPRKNKCLNMQSHAATNGGLPNVWNCVNHGDQLWKFVDGRLENVNHSLYCLEVTAANDRNGGSLTVSICDPTADNQIWFIE